MSSINLRGLNIETQPNLCKFAIITSYSVRRVVPVSNSLSSSEIYFFFCLLRLRISAVRFETRCCAIWFSQRRMERHTLFHCSVFIISTVPSQRYILRTHDDFALIESLPLGLVGKNSNRKSHQIPNGIYFVFFSFHYPTGSHSSWHCIPPRQSVFAICRHSERGTSAYGKRQTAYGIRHERLTLKPFAEQWITLFNYRGYFFFFIYFRCCRCCCLCWN